MDRFSDEEETLKIGIFGKCSEGRRREVGRGLGMR